MQAEVAAMSAMSERAATVTVVGVLSLAPMVRRARAVGWSPRRPGHLRVGRRQQAPRREGGPTVPRRGPRARNGRERRRRRSREVEAEAEAVEVERGISGISPRTATIDETGLNLPTEAASTWGLQRRSFRHEGQGGVAAR